MVSCAALAFAVAAALPFARAATSSPYRTTLQSTSAEIDYWPTANGSSFLTWNASWTGSSWNNWKEETVPQGMGFHYHSKNTTTIENADGEPVFLGHTFVGSSIEYWGYWSYPGTYGQASVNLTDEQGKVLVQSSGASGAETNSQSPVMLIKKDFDTNGNYTTRLVPNWGTIVFTHLVATRNISGTPDEIDKAAQNPTVFWFADLVKTGGEPNNFVTGPIDNPGLDVTYANGNWKRTPTIGAQGSGPEVPYRRVGSTDTNTAMTVHLGPGNIYVQLNGTMAWNHGIFQVEMKPAPPGRRAIEKYWGFTPWSVVNTTYYSTALDPSVNYTMTLTNLNAEGSDAKSVWFEPATVMLWKGKGGKSKTNVGAIAGGVVGGVLGLALIGALIFILMRCRRNKSRQMDMGGRRTPIDYDDTPAPIPTPFMSQPGTMSGYSHHGTMSNYSSGPGTATLAAPTESGYTDRTSDYFGGSQYAGSPASPQPMSVGSIPRKGGAPMMAVHHPQQAADAGTLHPVPNPEDDMIPPSYNPEWESSSTASMARTGGLAAPQLPEGAHQRNSMQAVEEPQEADLIKAQFTRRRPGE